MGDGGDRVGGLRGCICEIEMMRRNIFIARGIMSLYRERGDWRCVAVCASLRTITVGSRRSRMLEKQLHIRGLSPSFMTDSSRLILGELDSSTKTSFLCVVADWPLYLWFSKSCTGATLNQSCNCE